MQVLLAFSFTVSVTIGYIQDVATV